MLETSVAVVIPSFKRREVLGRCIDSVLGQTRLSEEVIVVDDGSSDGTANYVRDNYPNISVLVQQNRGVSAARNLSIRNRIGLHFWTRMMNGFRKNWNFNCML